MHCRQRNSHKMVVCVHVSVCIKAWSGISCSDFLQTVYYVAMALSEGLGLEKKLDLGLAKTGSPRSWP